MLKFLFSFFLLTIIITSCTHQQAIYDTSKPLEVIEKRDYRIDSIRKIVVIDNRQKKDLIIGDFNKEPLLITSALDNYLSKSYTNLICKDTSNINYDTITVFVDNLKSERIYSFWEEEVINSFNYTLDFPIRDKRMKLNINDTSKIGLDPDLKEQSSSIKAILRKNAELISGILKNRNNISDTFLVKLPKNNNTFVDTLNLSELSKSYKANGFLLEYQKGLVKYQGFESSYLFSIADQGILINVKRGFSFNYCEFNGKENKGIYLALKIPTIIQYKFNDLFNWYWGYKLVIGTEGKDRYNIHGISGGLESIQGAGVKIFENFNLNLNIYQLYNYKSNLVPYDLGIGLNLIYTTDYEWK